MQFLVPFLHDRENCSNTKTPSGDDESDKTEDENEEDSSPSIPCRRLLSPNLTTLSPSTSVKSRSLRYNSSNDRHREISNSTMTTGSNVETTVYEFIASRNVPSALPQVTEKKRKLMIFFEDIAESMAIFPDIDVAVIKSEIFRIVKKKEIEILENRQNENAATEISQGTL